ncbi:hypothetical protein ACN47E_007987 [Coniothyrium glycines]
MVDAQDTASKLFSTSRWRTKISARRAADENNAPPSPQAQDPDDLSAFLKPSTDRAQQHKDAAAAAFLASRPRIDVARAQRWPAAQDVLHAAAAAGGRSPGPGGLKTGLRKTGLTVAFVRTVPEVIGHGGDECEDPSIDVSRRKHAATAAPPPDTLHGQRPQDDAHVGAHSNMGRTPSQTEQRNSLTRTLTSHGETSPPLEHRMRMGHINAYAQPTPPPPQRVGQMGLGERPRGLARAPTGFDTLPEPAARRPSNESAYSQDSDNASPVLSRKAPPVEPTIEEEDGFRPKSLRRTQTGFREGADELEDSHAPAVPPMPPRLPEMRLVAREDDFPPDNRSMMAEHFLKSEPLETDSFSARVKQKMRSEEGRALQDAAQRAASGGTRDSDSSSMSSSDPFQIGTPPSSYASMHTARSPPQGGSPYERARASPMRHLDTDDPQRSRARGPSPRTGPLPPGVMPLHTDAKPSPSASPQTHTSPTMRSEPLAAVERHPSVKEYIPYSATSQQSMPFATNQYEQRNPPPPAQAQTPQSQVPMNAADPLLPITTISRQSSLKPGPDTGAQPNAPLARTDTRLQNEAAYKDFANRVTHMRGIFELTAQLGGNLYNHSPLQWLRVATWWFLKGRAGMESLIRSQSRNGEPVQERLTQPHVDLAKVWWIINEVLPAHPGLPRYGGQGPEAEGDLARKAGDATATEAYEIQTAIAHYMKLLVGSMKKHQSMPPTQALIQGQDQSIWEEYPAFAPDAASVLTTSPSRHETTNGNPSPSFRLSQYIPLADTKGEFCYFRMFVKASLSTDDPSTDRVPMSAVLSVLRPKDAYQVKLSICSQTSLINILIGGNSATSWRDVTWNRQGRKLVVQLRHGFNLTIELSDMDMRNLFSIVDHTNRVDGDLRQRNDERFACKMYLREASYKDSANPSAFPPERSPGCKLVVFQRIDRSSEGTGKRKLHRGYRMVLVTPTQSKQVSLVSHELGTKQGPINFEYVTEADQSPALRLHIKEEAADNKVRTCTAHLVFQDSKDRNHLFGTFTSMNLAEGEMNFAQVPLKAFHIESADQAEGFSQQGTRILEKLQWQEAKVMNQDPEAAGLEAAPTVLSESLRIVCRHTAGIISDRMNLGVGELLVRLPVDGAAELTLLREPQQDLAIAIDGSRSERDVPDALAELLRTLTSVSTIRRLTFNSFQDLHTFQLAVTGFGVIFDGIATTFSISRRRMVVPIYKQWTATTIRIQVVRQDNIIQLLAFFEDFSHADAMNFQLRTTDTFEKSDKSGKFGVKLVDAKFALPVEERRGEGKMQKEEGRLTGWSGTKRRFVCLDEIEYPGEHDDILIQFDSAETRDRFAEALPAAAMQRKFTVRRKI